MFPKKALQGAFFVETYCAGEVTCWEQVTGGIEAQLSWIRSEAH